MLDSSERCGKLDDVMLVSVSVSTSGKEQDGRTQSTTGFVMWKQANTKSQFCLSSCVTMCVRKQPKSTVDPL